MGGNFGGLVGRVALGAVGFGIGSMFGMPALGASLGMSLGAMLFSPKQSSGTKHVRGVLGTSSQESVPLPIVFGKVRIGATLLWKDVFVYHETEESAGGKGGGGSVITDQWYTVTFAMIICEGEADLVKMYEGKEDVGTSKAHTWYSGTPNQNPNSILTAGTGNALGYRHTCYVVFPDYHVGMTPQIPQMTFLITSGLGLFTVTMEGTTSDGTILTKTKEEYIRVTGIADVTPAWAINKLITNDRDGAGFTTVHHMNRNVDWNVAHSDCLNAGYLFNLAFTERRSLASLIEITATHGWITTIFSGADIKLLLANGDAPTKTIDIDEMLGRPGEQIISVAETSRSERFNRIAVEFTDPAKEYSTRPVQVEDIADQQDRGIYKNSVSLQGFTDKEIAKDVGYKMLRNSLFGRRMVSFSLGPDALTSEPGDIVYLNAASVGLSQMRARLIGMDETEEFNLTTTWREEPSYIYNPIDYVVPASSSPIIEDGYAGLSNAVGFEVTETPFELQTTDGGVDMGLIFSSTHTNTIGFNIYSSTDDTTFNFVKQTMKLSNYGAIVTDYGKDSWLDTTDLLIDTTDSPSSTFSSTSRNAMMNGANLALVAGQELVNYQTASVGTTYDYTISTFVRGRYNTKPRANVVGDSFLNIDNIDMITFLKSKIGTKYYFKAVPINTLGQVGDISEVSSIGMTVEGWAYRPYAPGSLWLEENSINQRGRSIAGATRDVKIAWDITDKSTGYGRFGYDSNNYGIYTQDPDYTGCEVDILVGGVVMRTADIGTTQNYTYLQSDNVADNSGFASEVDFRVYTKSIYGRSRDYKNKIINIL